MTDFSDLQPPPGSPIRVRPGPDAETIHFVLGRNPLRYASHLAPMALGVFAIFTLAQMDASHAAWIRSLPAANRQFFESHRTSALQGPALYFIVLFFFAVPLALFLIPALTRRHVLIGPERVETFVRFLGSDLKRYSLPRAAVEKIATRNSPDMTVRVMGIKMPSPKGQDILLIGPEGTLCFGGELPTADRDWLLAAARRLLEQPDATAA